jgi:predicted AlkP superfamily phosphohydrolase/phosphomutase
MQVLIIGLDVGDGNLIREWGQQGCLPVLNSLLQEGAWGWLRTTAETLHTSAWPSLYTGTLPGKHGVYYTFQPAPGLQGARHFGADQYGSPPVWQLLSQAGKRCVVLDAPYTHPHPDFRGTQVFDWGTWAHYWKPMSSPPQVMRQLTHACGAYPLGWEANQVGFRPLESLALQQRLIKSAAAKARAARWLMAQSSWELFLLVFGETHAAAHYCWPVGHAAASTGDAAYDMLRGVHEAIDHAIGEVLSQVGEDVTVFIVSGDGVGPNYSGWHLLPEILQRLEYTAGPGLQDTPGSQKKDLLKRLRDAVPSDLRQTVSRYLPTRWQDALMRRWATAGLDWSRTRAFCLPTDLEGCIRLNVKGREPHGIVLPGVEYTKACQELTASLEWLINCQNGHAAVRQVICTAEALPGPRQHYLPDLIVLWAEDAEITEVYSPALGTVRAPSPDPRPGTHRAPGFVLVRGPGVPPGQMLEGGHVTDLAPTLLAQFAVPVPPHMDGHVWHTLLPV